VPLRFLLFFTARTLSRQVFLRNLKRISSRLSVFAVTSFLPPSRQDAKFLLEIKKVFLRAFVPLRLFFSLLPPSRQDAKFLLEIKKVFLRAFVPLRLFFSLLPPSRQEAKFF